MNDFNGLFLIFQFTFRIQLISVIYGSFTGIYEVEIIIVTSFRPLTYLLSHEVQVKKSKNKTNLFIVFIWVRFRFIFFTFVIITWQFRSNVIPKLIIEISIHIYLFFGPKTSIIVLYQNKFTTKKKNFTTKKIWNFEYHIKKWNLFWIAQNNIIFMITY